MTEHKDIVIVGGSAAGVEAARAVASAGEGSSAMVISAEQRLPYKRTKVSKAFAAGFEQDAFALQEEPWWRDQGFDLRLGVRALSLDPEGRTLDLDDGSRMSWERLVLATGAEAFRLPLAEDVARSGAVHYAHDIAQVEALRGKAAPDAVRSVLVVGMGAMGVEVAEQLKRMGKEVTLAGDTGAVLEQELNAPAQALLAGQLQQNGVRLRIGETVCQVERAGQGLRVGFQGSQEEQVYDLVVFCIGTRLRTGLAQAAGLTVDRGVVVDQELRTSSPPIFAAGDAAQQPDGRVTYLWRHAMEQGRIAGLNAMGAAERYTFAPFRLKVKVFGSYYFALDRPAPADEERYEVAESRDGGRYLCAYYLGQRLSGLVMVNDPDNQKRYNLAVVEGWDRRRFEAEFL